VNESKTESGIVVLSDGNAEQQARLQLVRALLESGISPDCVPRDAERLLQYIKNGASK
jgi:hypothetical protein